MPQINAGFPGMTELVKKLHKQGYSIHTASNEPEFDLDQYLKGMGIRDYFGHLFGADIVGILKYSKTFYERVFSYSGVEPEQAIVIEDKPKNIHFIEELGATAVQSLFDGIFEPVTEYSFSTAEQLAEILKKLS